jgi:hypothetical protein
MADTTKRPLTFAYLMCAAILIPTALIAAWYTNETIWYGIVLVIIVFAVVDFGGQRLGRWLARHSGRSDKSGDRPEA